MAIDKDSENLRAVNGSGYGLSNACLLDGMRLVGLPIDEDYTKFNSLWVSVDAIANHIPAF